MKQTSGVQLDHGGIVRTDRSRKNISLVFTAHEFADGAGTISRVLDSHHIKAAFFFTGDFYRNPAFKSCIIRLKEDGHYLGAHSDKHLLYCSWENRDSTLVSRQEFQDDLRGNYDAMRQFGITPNNAGVFLPAYEWYNGTVSTWCRDEGLTLVNFTPGTSSNADYTTPDMGKQYLSSEEIYRRILRYEQDHPDGLNGFILLLHFGTDPKRTDKFYERLDELLTALSDRHYHFTRVDEAIRAPEK